MFPHIFAHIPVCVLNMIDLWCNMECRGVLWNESHNEILCGVLWYVEYGFMRTYFKNPKLHYITTIDFFLILFISSYIFLFSIYFVCDTSFFKEFFFVDFGYLSFFIIDFFRTLLIKKSQKNSSHF